MIILGRKEMERQKRQKDVYHYQLCAVGLVCTKRGSYMWRVQRGKKILEWKKDESQERTWKFYKNPREVRVV